MNAVPPRRDNGLRALSYARLDDVETHLVDELLSRLRDSGVAAYSAPTPGRQGPYGETVPPLGPSDSVYVDAAQHDVAKGVRDGYLREVHDDLAWSDIVAGYDRDETEAVLRWPVSEDVEPASGPTVGFGALRDHVEPERPARVGDRDDHYQPPPPPPLPQMDRVTRFAWAGALGGPLALVLAALTGLRLEGWVGLMAVTAFVAGFVTLVARMKDRSQDSDPDDGAVV